MFCTSLVCFLVVLQYKNYYGTKQLPVFSFLNLIGNRQLDLKVLSHHDMFLKHCIMDRNIVYSDNGFSPLNLLHALEKKTL